MASVLRGTARSDAGATAPPQGLYFVRAVYPPALVEEIVRTGEFSLMLFNGEFSHAVVKRPKSGDFRVQEHLGGVTLPSLPPPGGVVFGTEAARSAPSVPSLPWR